MVDFLTFKTFITPSLLVIMYIGGALVMPVVSYYLAKWIVTHYLSKQKEIFFSATTPKQRLIILVMFLGCFLCMEIMWRIMFEFVVAYFDMHAALMIL